MSTDDLADRLLVTFTGELEEQVQALNAELLELEGAPDDDEGVRSLFRIAHTVKGAARVAGVRPVERVCHQLEAIFASVRDGDLGLEPKHFQLLFEAADALEDAARRLRSGEPLEPGPLAALPPRLADVAGAETGEDPGDGAAAMAGAGGEPDRRSRSPGAVGDRPDGAEAAARTDAVTPETAAEPTDAPLRIRPERLDSLLASAGELLVLTGALRNRPAELAELHELVTARAAEWRRIGERLRRAPEGGAVESVGEEAVRRVEAWLAEVSDGLGALARRIRADTRALGRLAGDITGTVRAMRLRPFSEACQALPRAVRDVAASSGKEARLELEGQDVEADRAIVDALREPLLHLVRNAVDHGIEDPAARAAAGKPTTGTIKVSARLGDGRFIVTVADDGAGLDVETLRERLRERDGEAPESDAVVVRRLFRGGLTTRARPTEISGRGVGLELVQWTMDRVGGSVEVIWNRSAGTTFILNCPQSAATLRVLLVRADSVTVGVPIAHVERVARIRSDELRLSEGGTVMPSAKGPIPVRTLAGLLGPPLTPAPVEGTASGVLLAVGDTQVLALVDALLGEKEVVVRALQHRRRTPRHVAGGALLPDGAVALVANVPALLGAATRAGAAEVVLADAGAGWRRPARRILVVDDSITTRTLEQSVLEAAGYDVMTAADGEAAWQTLQERGADLVVADIEMPRMGGFELCETIRGSERFRELPVVLVTALEQPEYRERGLEAGADAYLPKSSFDQEHLLRTVEELIG